MAVQDRTKLTVKEFDCLAQLPENAHRWLEYVGGRVIEVVSNNLSSEFAAVTKANVRKGKPYLYLS